jgi:hypothetical protein
MKLYLLGKAYWTAISMSGGLSPTRFVNAFMQHKPEADSTLTLAGKNAFQLPLDIWVLGTLHLLTHLPCPWTKLLP